MQVFAADAAGELLATHSFNEATSTTRAHAVKMLVVRTARQLYYMGNG